MLKICVMCVVFDSQLIFDDHINETVNKVYSMLGLINHNFNNMSNNCLIMLYKALVRSHLEYTNTVWSPIRI